MTLRIDSTNYGVGHTGINCLSAYGNDHDVLIKNVGASTVYIGAVDPSGSTGVSTNMGFPILPGEQVTVPNPASTSHRVGFNTEAPNTSAVRALTVVTE